jgi:3-hydroxyacyl-CoA dehydrogenase
VLCGGELESGSLVDENWFLTLERREFMGLLRNAKTQERVAHTLKTGKPLRN